MNTATATHDRIAREDPGHAALGEKVKALIWEECRVGGSISVVTFGVGLFALVMSGWFIGVAWMRSDPLEYAFLALAAPLCVALLLILNPDYSGHMAGGFSQRILRLPVPTYVAVAVSLGSRTVFVFLVALLSILAWYGWLWSLSISLNAVWMVTLLYLGCQLIDWLRRPFSGLTSLLLIALAIAVPYSVISDAFNPVSLAIGLIRDPAISAGLGLFVIVPALALIYVIAVPVVHAARIGRRVGIPEFWEWPRRLSLQGTGRRRPFRSATGAQVWYELRRWGWVMPSVSIVFWLCAAGMTWAYASADDESDLGLQTLQSVLPFLAVIVGAAAHAAGSGIPRIRRSKSLSDYPYLQPLTTEQLARCRMIANAICLTPLVVLAVVLHFAVAGGADLLAWIGEAYGRGLTSSHEILRIFVGRAVLAGLLAWAAMSISTRLSIWAVAIALPLILVTEVVTGYPFGNYVPGISLLPVGLLFAGLTAVMLRRLAVTHVVASWSAATLTGAWLAATWLIYGVAGSTIAASATSPFSYLFSGAVCLGLAGLLVLPYVGILLDARQHRHASAPEYDPDQFESARAAVTPRSWRLRRVGLALTLAFVLWLGWPGEPAFKDIWRAEGLPTNLAELDAWYPAVPRDDNHALQYLEIANLRDRRESAFRYRIQEQPADLGGAGVNRLNNLVNLGSADADWFDNLAIIGGAAVDPGEPLPEPVRAQTEEYWRFVTSEVAPELKRVAATGGQPSRYPIDLRDGYETTLPHLARLRGLARELSVDALHWSLAGDTGRATESILSILPLTESLDAEPVLISQLVRIAILTMPIQALEDILNRTQLAPDDLARLQTAFANVLPPVNQKMILDRAMVGEPLFALNVRLSSEDGQHIADARMPILAPLLGLVRSADLERLMYPLYYEMQLTASRLPWPQYAEGQEEFEDVDRFFTIAPFFAIMAPSLSRSYEAEWRIRTQLDIARTAVAVERYRIANGRLPRDLTELVPAYIDAVPQDYFSPTGSALRYTTTDDGGFTVYSVSRDMEDDGGSVGEQSWWVDGDILFRVATPDDRPAHGDVNANP